MLTLNRISKSFSNVTAVDNLSLEIPQESIFGLLGPNGAGKTTTIRMIMDIIKPDSGTIHYKGKRLTKDTYQKIGYLPEERGLYQKRPLAATIQYFAKLRGLKKEEAVEQTQYYLKRFELASYENQNIEELSKGNQQKVQFIISIIHNPEIVILDEPFSGLDPVNQLLLKDIINELHKSGSTVIFSTHQMEQVEKICNTICLLNQGRKVLFGSLEEIKKEYGARVLNLEYAGENPDLSKIDSLNILDRTNSKIRAEIQDKANLNRILKQILELVTVTHFNISEPSLEQIFIDNVQNTEELDINV